jgi:predicted amidohydrolase YtcJ
MSSAFRAVLTACLVTLAGAPILSRQPASPGPADLVLRNGRIVTLEAAGDVRGLAARGDRIVAVGSDADVAPLIGPATRVIDLGGRLAIPGFIEGHAHFTGIGEAKLNLDLMSAASWGDIVAMVADAAERAKPGEWILGRGWHQEKWTRRPDPHVEGFPTHDALSRVSPDNPVLLTHASGHATFANRRAMELAGVTRETPDPPGGDILRDESGAPIGVFRETASALVRRAQEGPATPEARIARLRRLVELASQEVLSKGITTVQDAGSPFDTIEVFRALAEERRLAVRLWVMVREKPEILADRLERSRIVGAGDHHLTVQAIKITIDGALGSRGAWLLAPYSDQPDSVGHNTTLVETVAATAALALRHGFQLAVHAIGDRGNREALNVMEAAIRTQPAGADLRWRIEHAQHLNAADIPRFGRLGVIASMQGIHCTSDAPYVLARLGAARAEEGAYVWRKLLQSGATVINGTDAPVEDVDPIASYYASVTRRLDDGREFYPEQRMTRLEALRSYTLSAAYAAFEESLKGSLAPGKLADITVLSKDILTVPEEEIRQARVEYTIVGGKVAYERRSSAGRP